MADDHRSRTLSYSSLCNCSDRQAVHVHCFCTTCNGKAVNYRTQRAHSQAGAVLNAYLSTHDHQTDQRIAVHEHLESDHEANAAENTNEGNFVCLICLIIMSFNYCLNSFFLLYALLSFFCH